MDPAAAKHQALKEETIAIDRDWVYNQECRLSHDIQVISNFFVTFDNLLYRNQTLFSMSMMGIIKI